MIRHNSVTSILRFYNNDNPSDFEDYVAVCNIFWEDQDTIWIYGFNGNLTRKHLRALLKFFVEQNIKLIKAKRSPFRALPCSKEMFNHHEILVDDLVKRFGSKS